MKNIVYLNGKYLPLKKAKISVLDRGFLFADGVYEVIPIYDGKLFGAKQHLDRLQQSQQGICMTSPLSHEQWHDIFAKLLKKNKITQGNYHVYLQVTRGAAAIRSHKFPENVVPTIFVQINPSPYALPYETLCEGKAAITSPDMRWEYCHIKSIALLPNILLTQKAKDAGCNEAILIKNGYAVEGASSNLFIVKGKTIITPPLANSILPGITRQKILELAAASNISYKEQTISEAELRKADEIWIASSTREIYPIVKLDNKPVGDGKAGPVWKQIIKLYHEARNA